MFNAANNTLFDQSEFLFVDGEKFIFDEEVVRLSKEARSEARKSNKGVIIASIHYGCFDYLAHALGFFNEPFAMLTRDFGLRRLDKWWTAQREMYGNEVFARTGGYGEVEKRLNKGQDVGILFDQNVKGSHAVFVDFFGIKAATTKIVALASLRTGAPIVIYASAYLESGHFKVYAKHLPSLKDASGSREEKIIKTTEELNAFNEELIIKHPEQWYWIHRRFKSRPKGEPENLYN